MNALTALFLAFGILGGLTVACALIFLAIFLAAAVITCRPRRGGHERQMAGLGHPVGRLPRRWRRRDWAELDTLTETAKD